MALSMDGISSYLNTDTSYSNSSQAASKISNSISSVNGNSSDEEMTEAVESFESYMLEQVIKQVKDSIKMDDEEKDSNSQMTEYYMDSTIQSLASTIVKDYDGTLTEDLVAQMKRNYGISNEQSLMGNANSEDATNVQQPTSDNVTPEQAAAAASAAKEEE
ncbi:MAG: hypothetical protein K5644_01155 [Lachnospiraceae bacterium]|nr:hypothetical protein [Lachnospiraceae bacterium]